MSKTSAWVFDMQEQQDRQQNDFENFENPDKRGLNYEQENSNDRKNIRATDRIERIDGLPF